MSMKNPNLVNDRPMRDLIRDHLQTGESISNVEAQALWRCRALPKRINELRREGLNIVAQRRKDSTGQSYVRYVLAEFAT